MRNILITGGAGFIGANTAEYFLKKGDKVWILDNLSRVGSKLNLEWLVKNFPKIEFIKGDIRNFSLLKKSVIGKDIIFHFAGQVAVTTSVKDPREDFEINTLGTFNLLEAMRKVASKAILFYSSTNKVYGGMENEEITEGDTRYSYKKLKFGVSENYQLDFHSPYGCSKGAADQYVRDYARIYGLKTVVFRQSCIYGYHQFGMEDQGWIAWFIIALLLGKKITIYGNGKQVRDVLFITDLLNAYDLAAQHIKGTSGQVYNIGGGTDFSLSIWIEFKPFLEKLLGKNITEFYENWRPGDQLIYISDIRKSKADFKWEPKVKPKMGIEELFKWAARNKDLFNKLQ